MKNRTLTPSGCSQSEDEADSFGCQQVYKMACIHAAPLGFPVLENFHTVTGVLTNFRDNLSIDFEVSRCAYEPVPFLKVKIQSVERSARCCATVHQEENK